MWAQLKATKEIITGHLKNGSDQNQLKFCFNACKKH